jgi:hypothetical protein
LDELVEIGVHDINALAVRPMRPVHVAHDVSWKMELLNSGNPRVNVGYQRLEEVTVGGDDTAEFR